MDAVTASKLEPGMPGGPTTIGRYKILQVVGRGAYGRVFACYDPVLDRRVAVKVTAADVPDGIREEQLQRFKIEAQVLGRLQHPNIVAVYDAGVDDDRPYLAMELCSGPSLEHVLARSRLSLREIAAVTAQVASALDYIHAQDILHRDIKPANVLLHEGRIKLTDFGLARTGGMGRLTVAGQVMGTPSFMAPEQVRGEKMDRRSDLYALGVLMFNMRAGRPPFIGDPLLVMSQLASRPVPALSTMVADTPEVLDEFFARALAMDPAERFSSGALLCRALARVMQIIEGGGTQGAWAGGSGGEFGLEGAAPAGQEIGGAAAGAPGMAGMAGDGAGMAAGGMAGHGGLIAGLERGYGGEMPGAMAGPGGHGGDPMAVPSEQLMGMAMAGGQGQAANGALKAMMAGRVMRPPWDASSGANVPQPQALAPHLSGGLEAADASAPGAGMAQTLRSPVAGREGGVIARLAGMIHWQRVNLMVTVAILITAGLWTIGIARVSYRASNGAFRGPRFHRAVAGVAAPVVPGVAVAGEPAQAGTQPAGVPSQPVAGGPEKAGGVAGGTDAGARAAGSLSPEDTGNESASTGSRRVRTDPGKAGRRPGKTGLETPVRTEKPALSGGRQSALQAVNGNVGAQSGVTVARNGSPVLVDPAPRGAALQSNSQSASGSRSSAALAPIASGTRGPGTERTSGRTGSSSGAGSESTADVTPPFIRLRPVGTTVAEQKVRLEAEMVPMRSGFEVQCQWKQDGRWFPALVRELGGGRYAVDLVPRAGRLDYRFELVDAYGARRGSAAQTIDVQPGAASGGL